MPRQLKEIKNFTSGTVSNISERDIPADTPSFSLNINPNSENGILDAIKTDKLLYVSNDNFTTMDDAVTWGSLDLNSEDSSGANFSRIRLDDISIFQDKSTSRIRFMGTKGVIETLLIREIEPHFERVSALTFQPTSALGKDDGVIPYHTTGNDMSSGSDDFVKVANIQENDYISFCASGSSFTGRAGFEIMKVLSIDTVNNNIYVKRRCFGTQTTTLSASTEYEFYMNRITAVAGGSQATTKMGTCLLNGWSDYSGNNIGGHGQYMTKCSSGDVKKNGKIDTSSASQTISYNATDKTITFANVTSLSFNEGDTITMYHSAASSNNGKSFKILKKVESGGDTTLTVDTAPVQETESSDTVYTECNMIKNYSFFHIVSDNTITPGASSNYKVNDWLHQAITNNSYSNQTSTKVAITGGISGGLWDETQPWETADASAFYYPFQSGVPFIILTSEYAAISKALTTSITSDPNDNKLQFNRSMETLFSSGDIIAFIADSDTELDADTEYMKVLSIDSNIVNVQRGIFGTTPVAITAGGSVYPQKCKNHLITQSIPKDNIKSGQSYKLSFYAKGNTSSGSTLAGARGALALSINGGYISSDGEWIAANNHIKNGIENIDNKTISQEDRWIGFESLDNAYSDSAGNSNKLDDKWRKFVLKFTIPSNVSITTDLKIELSSRGKEASNVLIDVITLNEDTLIYPYVQDESKVSITGQINNSGSQDLVIYDNIKKSISVITGFSSKGNPNTHTTNSNILSSDLAATTIYSSGNVSMVSRNREVHIGFGGGNTDSPPQWVGYLNHKLFGIDNTNVLYQDEDTVHNYDKISASSFTKICLAGEHEYLRADWDNSASTLDITHIAHSMNAGDNIVIREWGDASHTWEGEGVWVVTSTPDADSVICKRRTQLDKNPSNNNFLQTDGNRNGNEGKICYRPYYYYACKEGENSIYRITPDSRIKSDLSVDTDYVAGTIERSQPLSIPVQSICTYYAKEASSGTAATNGGRIYALSANSDSVLVVDVQLKYDEWETSYTAEYGPMTLAFKSFKWSNERTDGDIASGVGIFGGTADETSPTISYAGKLSDIVETKGPNELFVHAATNSNHNEPDHFDTRLWVQSHHGDDESFTSGDRFLFCGLTNETNTDGGDTLFMADRTPPLTDIYDYNDIYLSSSSLAFSTEYENEITSLPRYNGYPTSKFGHRYYETGHGENPSNTRQSIVSKIIPLNYPVTSNESLSTNIAMEGGTFEEGDYSYYNFGYNMGFLAQWQDEYIKPKINIAKYGLFPMSDNDKDGVIDGTGIIMPSTTTLPDTVDNRKMGPYGEKHRRITAHCVGIIGGCDKPWIRSGGKSYKTSNNMHVQNTNINPGSEASTFEGSLSQDLPEQISLEKFIAICPDIHFGDMQMESSLTVKSSGSAAYDIPDSSISTDKATEIQLDTGQTTANLQAGDPIYIDDAKYGATYIVKITATDKFVVPIEFDSDVHGDTIYPMTLAKQHNNADFSGAPNCGSIFPGDDNQAYHWAFDNENPDNGSIFTDEVFDDATNVSVVHQLQHPGYYTKTFYTTPNFTGLGRDASLTDGLYPGFINKLDKLNYRAGVMFRPFDTHDNTFEDLIIGNNISVDMPSYCDANYHVKNSTDAPTKLHYHVNNTAVNNNFASRLFISCPQEGESSDGHVYSSVYICDLNDVFPDKGIGLGAKDMDNPDVDSTASYDIAPLSNDIYLTATLPATPYVHVDSNDYPSAHLHPYIILPGTGTGSLNDDLFKSDSKWRNTNAFSGMCITVVDAITRTQQTRQIVWSVDPIVQAGGSAADSNDIYVFVNYPFGHEPAENDKIYITSPHVAATAPVKLLGGMPGHTIGESHSAGIARMVDPIIIKDVYDLNHIVSLTSSGTTASGTISTNHNLCTGDIINVHTTGSQNTTIVEDYEGVYSITVTGPKTFTYTTTGSGLASTTGVYKVISEINKEEINSISNPLYIQSSNPIIKSTFGGLDTRKAKTATIDSVADNSDDITLTASANHLFDVGDSVTFDSGDSDQDGNYIIKADNGTTTFDITNTDSTNSTGTAYTNQWELIVAETSGKGRIGELRSGLNNWDRGNSKSNIIRNDLSTAEEGNVYLSALEENVSIEPSGVSGSGDYFLKNTKYQYKISLIYDGYQEGPLSNSLWEKELEIDTYPKMNVTITLKDHSKRLTHVCLYRRNGVNDLYSLVKEVRTDTGWVLDEGKYSRQIMDDGTLGATYEARTGLSEVLDTIKIKYGISEEVSGYLFVGDCNHNRIKKASNMIFRSKPGMFSIFDYANDFLVLKSKPTALANFNGRLYAFDNSNIYRINPENLSIEDVFEGVGCINQNSVIVTEYGMFFADLNGAYMHNGQAPVKISDKISQAGGTDTDFYSEFECSDNVRDLSWNNLVRGSNNPNVYVTYDSDSNCALFISQTNDNINKGTLSSKDIVSVRKSFCWSYNITKQRWDLWELSEDSTIGKPFIDTNSNVCIPIDNTIYQYRGGSSKRYWTWVSKKITMGEDSIVKVFNKIKLNGVTNNLNLSGSNKESSNRLLVVTSEGAISNSDNTYTAVSNDHSDYKLSGSNKKGRWMQFKLEEMTDTLDSVGIIFRRKSTK